MEIILKKFTSIYNHTLPGFIVVIMILRIDDPLISCGTNTV